MASFRLTPAAEEHIGDIVEFIAADNETLPFAFVMLCTRPSTCWRLGPGSVTRERIWRTAR